MRTLRIIAAMCLALQAQAWNATGHRIIAAIAYDHLTPRARAQVDALLEKHPDYGTILTLDAPPDPAGRARAAFLAASIWPDVIKGDKRFYDDTRPDAQPTPLLPGFPSMARHTNWHYVDIPFSPDGTALEQPKAPNALGQMERILKKLGPEDDEAPYELPWLLHVEGDVHQPLHCTSRFVMSQPMGDAGGNSVFVLPGRNLHAFWDGIAGSDTSPAFIDSYAREVTDEYVRQHGVHPHLSKDPKRWIDEGFRLAKSQVYTFGPQTGLRESPIVLPAGYEANARRVARIQFAVAGFRLAEALNHRFK